MLVFNTFPANVKKKRQAVCVWVFLILYNTSFSLGAKLLFNIKHIPFWTTYGQSCHKMPTKQDTNVRSEKWSVIFFYQSNH